MSGASGRILIDEKLRKKLNNLRSLWIYCDKKKRISTKNTQESRFTKKFTKKTFHLEDSQISRFGSKKRVRVAKNPHTMRESTSVIQFQESKKCITQRNIEIPAILKKRRKKPGFHFNFNEPRESTSSIAEEGVRGRIREFGRLKRMKSLKKRHRIQNCFD